MDSEGCLGQNTNQCKRLSVCERAGSGNMGHKDPWRQESDWEDLSHHQDKQAASDPTEATNIERYCILDISSHKVFVGIKGLTYLLYAKEH